MRGSTRSIGPFVPGPCPSIILERWVEYKQGKVGNKENRPDGKMQASSDAKSQSKPSKSDRFDGWFRSVVPAHPERVATRE